MKRLNLMLIAVALAMNCLMWGSAVQAAMVSYNDSVTGSSPSTYGKFTADLLSLPQFDSTLGTLTQVTLTLSNDFYAYAKGEYTGTANNGKTFSYSLNDVYFDIRFAGDSNKLLTDNQANSGSNILLYKYDNITDYAGTSGKTWIIDPAKKNAEFVYTNGLIFDQFIGNGQINFDIYTRAILNLVKGDTKITTQQLQQFLATAGVTYEYTPVPIPAAAWLLGTGLIGLVVIRRKRGVIR